MKESVLWSFFYFYAALTPFGLNVLIHHTFVQHIQEVKPPSIALDLILCTVTGPLFSDLIFLIGSSSVSKSDMQTKARLLRTLLYFYIVQGIDLRNPVMSLNDCRGFWLLACVMSWRYLAYFAALLATEEGKRSWAEGFVGWKAVFTSILIGCQKKKQWNMAACGVYCHITRVWLTERLRKPLSASTRRKKKCVVACVVALSWTFDRNQID